MLFSKLLLLAFLTLAVAYVNPSYNEKNNITRKDPSFPFQGEMFTGFIVIDNNTQANLFYHLFAFNQTQLSKSAPLVIWLQGGPGCGSSFGNYDEIGPVKIFNNSRSTGFVFERNPETWNNQAHLLFIDQPTGSGFSQANGLKVNSTVQAAQNFQVFLARFYQLYPELTSSYLYIFGESYAGKYIPVFTTTLLKNQTFSSKIRIGGIGIGDGWSDPVRQVPTYGTFGYAAGIIGPNTRDTLRKQEYQAISLIKDEQYGKATKLSNKILDDLSAAAGGVSEYNYREYDSDDMFPFSVWLNTAEAQDYLEIPHQEYFDCNPEVSDDFVEDNTQSVADYYSYLISNIPVLLYNGQDDDNCDYEGVINYINALNWSDIKNFRSAKRTVWSLSDGTKAGLVKRYGNFTFLMLYQAGHMVPSDQPKASSQMLYNFLNKKPFN